MTDFRFAPLAEQDSTPLYRQLYERVRGAIAAGSLGPGDRLPSARALAKELGVARGTIELAYSLLTSEGYLLARGQAGTVVNPQLHAPATPVAPPPSEADSGEDAPDSLWRPPQLLPFQMGVPALDAFPRKIWARLGARYLRGLRPADMDYPPTHGLPALRSAIASYLQVSRGIDCGAHQVFITSGWRASLAFVAHAVLSAGQRAWVEDPGYPPARQILRQFGLEPVPVEVDEQGLRVDRGIALAKDARLAVVTPAHQSPLSMTLSLPRRQALLEWASHNDAWVMEDDYDGEYRYASRPLPALASLDRHGRVFYAGTFSKVLFPGIRLAYLVVPQAQVVRFEQVGRALFAAAMPGMTQALVADFIAEGHFTRHIQRMRRLYGERRSSTIAALERGLAGSLQVEQAPGGMNLVLRLPGEASDQPLAEHLLAHGLAVQPLSRWWASSRRDSALLLSFTNCTSPEQAQRLGELIRQAL
ncbi:PLP-dependent aminotransferase family protein [Pseudomonas sp. ML96]|uniref:MocR-like pyridoxine biosynthesis transcription factor PdxR n=1 Tax=Pseudomonas sp. ML96 TaxID=1523503 RepID=UPI0005B827AC|nr:PLP-dependent aminotransferase family protein [Pseudomonas sp. ML96]